MDSYLLLRSTVRDLETWLMSNLQGILDSGDNEAAELTNRVDADLIELGEGLIDETTLRERLDSYVRAYNTISVDFFETERITCEHATAINETFSDRFVVPGLVESHRVDVVFA
jgi:hypothetical protein